MSQDSESSSSDQQPGDDDNSGAPNEQATKASLPVEVSVESVAAKIASGESITLIDCREPWEHEIAQIAGSELVPMVQIPGKIEAFDAQSDHALVVYCHQGVRSLQVVNFLRQRGIYHAQSMRGGIEEWSTTIDPTVPRYS
ncbi:MAG: rhodanese-like domain-containing protein [Planctomycetota bacterium]